MVDLNSPELQAFREEIRLFLRDHLTGEMIHATRADPHVPRPVMAAWQSILNDRGWGAPHWPVASGGTGWPAIQRYVFEQELAFADAPLGDVVGLFLAGPMLAHEGSPEQKERYLPKILSGEEMWCQGFSEPNAGSDLASLTTTARRDGDHWVLNGQKTWLSYGHQADYMFLLARTDPDAKPQAGLSQFIVDMRDPGLTLQPIYTMEEGHSVNALFIDEVRVPASAMIGEINRGWDYAKDLLSRERVNNSQAPRTKRDIVELHRLAERCFDADGGSLAEDPRFRRRLQSITADFVALETAVLEVLAGEAQGKSVGAVASTLKIRGSELQQRVAETGMEMLGGAGLVLRPGYGEGPLSPTAEGWVSRHYFRRVVTIYAGSNEIQKTIIAKSMLGM
jgi:alkylation response protein AidB-like acyl-CoA dehydrogenase